MERRNFLKYAAGAVTAACSLSIPQSATAESVQEEPQSEDALNPGGVRVGGIRMIPVCGGKYQVWTKRLGSGPVKVLLLHGGPGFPHDYLEAMESFLPQAGIEMYYYDQLGVGNSDIPDDPSLWTLPRYLTEVEEVRRGLHLDQFVLYGHSWGGMLAMEYALNYEEHLRGLVISNMTAGIKSELKRLDELKTTLLSQATLAQFNALETARDYDSPAYKRIVMEELYPQMICPVDSVARTGHACLPVEQRKDLQPDAGQKRIRVHRQSKGLGALGPVARDSREDAHHRSRAR
jgi:proline iminopeptidase